MKKLLLGVVFFAMSLQVGGGVLYAAADQKEQVGDTNSYFDQFVQAIGSRANATKNELSLLWGYLIGKYIRGEKTTKKEDERAKRIQKKLGIAIGTLVVIVATIMGIKWYKKQKATPLQSQPSAPTQLPVQTGKATNMPEEEGQVDLEVVDPNINKQDCFGDTLLHYAVASGNFEAISSLLKKGADINMQGYRGNTPLHIAANNEKLNVASLLIEKGADKNVTNAFGQAPLHIAAENGKLNVASLLIEKGADKNVTNAFGQTPLHIAAENGKFNVASLLIEKGADVNAKDKSRQTPLHEALASRKPLITNILVTKRADINAEDIYGNTPLFYFFNKINRDEESLRTLLQNGADLFKKNKEDRTPYDEFLANKRFYDERINNIIIEINNIRAKKAFLYGKNVENSPVSGLPNDVIKEIFKHVKP